jgi:hypothetical protein
MTWPGGWGSEMHLLGQARDLLTPVTGGPAQVLAADTVRAVIGPDRVIEAITADPPRPGMAQLTGARGGGGLRHKLAEAVPAELAAGSPLYLLLDDIAGATLIGGFAYSQWPSEWPEAWSATRAGSGQRRVEGICIGFAPGSSGLDADGRSRFIHDLRPVPPLAAPDDPLGWHQLGDVQEVSMRRARRIDVTTGNVITVDAMFQDSATVPTGGRVAVHEYQLSAQADPVTGELLSVHADPRVLPYQECPMAAANVGRLVGTPMAELRTVVLERLRTVAGCTHLNDALRALAEVPVLARHLT